MVRNVPGTTSAYAERVIGGYYLDIVPDREALARYGLLIGNLQDTIAMALGGEAVTTTVEGRERYTVNIRYPRDFRDNPEAIAREVLVPLPGGGAVPLGEVAKVQQTRGPTTFARRMANLPSIFTSTCKAGFGGYVVDAQKAVADGQVPAGTYVQWSGQFEYMQRAQRETKNRGAAHALDHISAALPQFRNADRNADRDALAALCAGGRPLADVVAWLQYVGRGCCRLHRSCGRGGGNRVVMLIYLDHALKEVKAERKAQGEPFTKADLHHAIMLGAVERVRPKMMTVAAIMAGLLPILWSTGTGSEVMQRIAVPMIGGMISSTVLTLVVIPVYALAKGYGLPRAVDKAVVEKMLEHSRRPGLKTARNRERRPKAAE